MLMLEYGIESVHIGFNYDTSINPSISLNHQATSPIWHGHWQSKIKNHWKVITPPALILLVTQSPSGCSCYWWRLVVNSGLWRQKQPKWCDKTGSSKANARTSGHRYTFFLDSCSKNLHHKMSRSLSLTFLFCLCIFVLPARADRDCDDTNPCIARDVHAKCTNNTAGPRCICSSPQFSGPFCDKSWCDAGSTDNPCTKKDPKATCTDVVGGGYTCTCSSQQYTGKKCENSWFVSTECMRIEYFALKW